MALETMPTGRALGSLKTAAQRIGVSFDHYVDSIRGGLRWCHGCRRFLATASFCVDKSRSDGLTRICGTCRNIRNRSAYTPKPGLRCGPKPKAARDGDKRQARKRVNQMVKAGELPSPNDVPCTDCNHVATIETRRHEYDHYLGYGAANHLDVQAVCTKCHRRRETDRGVYPKAWGMFAEEQCQIIPK